MNKHTSNLLTTDDLYEWFRCKQPSKLKRLMRERNIAFHLDAVGGPITTMEAINGSLNGTEADHEIEF